MNHQLDLKHVGLIVSVGAAVAARFLSDFSVSTLQNEALVANLNLSRFSLASFGALFLNSLSYELQRDWFNLSAQALPELAVLVGVLLAAYAGLRRLLAPEPAVALVLLVTPLLPLVAMVGVCALVLTRAARAA